ncbi:hypothetical protein E2605_18265 [Dysgonomonas capnocytophagoides]|uniref:Uncharacterized protein n=1 Tax=Dysgonomonas capnocytophagoides TaxID=45254 RepID=A0A4Y8KV59_9BACT|nr:hypothetical protein [Dysgonomonas capnocytophagoides]TFD92788.1 hypothetical protein E2605_18265 [Dysgonomonas capnocytophagoides]
MKHLTTIENLKSSSSRFISSKLDDGRIEPYIDESEQMNIKSQIGDALFINILEYVNADDKSGFPDYSILLNGGTYQIKNCDNDFEKRSFKGLIEALNYYVWSRIVKNNNYTLTRYGLVNKNDPYSANAELKERLAVEKDALSIADKYLSECIDYLKANKSQFPLFKKGKQRNRLRIRVIGD